MVTVSEIIFRLFIYFSAYIHEHYISDEILNYDQTNSCKSNSI